MYANNVILSLASKGWGVSLLLAEVVVADQELVVAF
jgi:hypothetical protein